MPIYVTQGIARKPRSVAIIMHDTHPLDRGTNVPIHHDYVETGQAKIIGVEDFFLVKGRAPAFFFFFCEGPSKRFGEGGTRYYLT